MHYGSHAFRRSLAIMVLVVYASALGACSNSASPMAPTVQPGSKTASSSNQYITVDDPACFGINCGNEVTGINDNRDIVGNYTDCGTSKDGNCSSQDWSCNPNSGTQGGCQPCPLVGGANAWTSYTAAYSNGSYPSFTNQQFPDAPQGQYMSAISDRLTGSNASGRSNFVTPTPPPTIVVGCINTFAGGSGEEHGVWALFNNGGLWSTHDKGPGDNCDSPIHDGTGELLGYDRSNVRTPTAVGFYNDSRYTCTFRAGEIQAGQDWKAIPVTLAFATTSVMATGITGSGTSLDSGDIVGTATRNATSNANTQVGWFLQSGSASAKPYYYPGSTVTAFTGIARLPGASEPDIVGWYTTGAATHGLVAVPAPSTPTGFRVTSIDEPQATGFTAISGINANGDICGWYIADGKYHGFVGIGVVSVSNKLHRRHATTKPHEEINDA